MNYKRRIANTFPLLKAEETFSNKDLAGYIGVRRQDQMQYWIENTGSFSICLLDPTRGKLVLQRVFFWLPSCSYSL